MNELTLNLTTIRPDRKPTPAHVASATTAAISHGRSVLAWNQLTITSENASIAPQDRSNVPAVKGTRTARPRIPMTTWSPSTTLNVVWVRNVSGIHRPKITKTNANR